uniref:NADH dehydrogenase [ubiquinone] 1 beta subcomplex subunit 10-like n=1 Tax=Myxine glutinosa TaxID=7769 RepID=UPI00358F1879
MTSSLTWALHLTLYLLTDWVSTQQQKNKIYYYHRRYNRVPDITQCVVGDYICQYEAEIQWHRDWMVDKEIVKVLQERLQACHTREGPDSEEMCREDIEKFEKTMKAFNCRYGELGALATARSSLMKQKERMIKERQQQQQQQGGL